MDQNNFHFVMLIGYSRKCGKGSKSVPKMVSSTAMHKYDGSRTLIMQRALPTFVASAFTRSAIVSARSLFGNMAPPKSQPTLRRSNRVLKRPAAATLSSSASRENNSSPSPKQTSKRHRKNKATTSPKQNELKSKDETPADKTIKSDDLNDQTNEVTQNDEVTEGVETKRRKSNAESKKEATPKTKRVSKTKLKAKPKTDFKEKTVPTNPPQAIYPPQHGDMPFPSETSPVPPNITRLVSWNVTSFRAIVRSESLQNYLTKESPHMLLIQETKMTEQVVEKEFKPIENYSVHWFHSERKGYSGVAALVRDDFAKNVSRVERGVGDQIADSEGRVMTVYVKTPNDKTVCVVVAYVPNAGAKLARLDYRTNEFEPALREYLQKLGTNDEHRSIIYCGDLNVAYQEIDIHNSKGNVKSAGHTPQERKEFGNLLELAPKWVDCYRSLYADFPGYTYYSKRFGDRLKLAGKGWRLDYFLLDSSTFHENKCVEDCFVRSNVIGSDHYPLVLDIDLTKL